MTTPKANRRRSKYDKEPGQVHQQKHQQQQQQQHHHHHHQQQQHQKHPKNDHDFGIIRRVAGANSEAELHECIDALQPKDIDNLGAEITTAFQCCSLPESNRSPSSSIEDEESENLMVAGVEKINVRFRERSRNSGSESTASAMYRLFRKTTITATNLEALLRMCDVDIRTGRVRSFAIWFLCDLTYEVSIWQIHMKDGTSFSLNLIRTLSKFLDDEAKREDIQNSGCQCPYVWYSLLQAIQITKDEPREILCHISSFDWTCILQCKYTSPPYKDHVSGVIEYYDMSTFVCLRKLSEAAIRENPDDLELRELIHKLGACHELFRTVLTRIIAGDLWYSPFGSAKNIFEDLPRIHQFIFYFINCLVPLPSDHETDDLVRRARACLKARLMTSLKDKKGLKQVDPGLKKASLNASNSAIYVMEASKWTELQNESEKRRWERFESLSFQSESNKERRNRTKKMSRSYVQQHIGKAEMCANCFVLQKDLKDDSTLLKCIQCRQIKYCSRECQREHWKKSHKHQCQAQKAAA